MNYKAFEYLELLPELLEKISHLEEKISHLEENLIEPLKLDNRKSVLKYLNISNSTLNNMLKDGRFKESIHYHRQIKNNRYKIIFVESAIIEYKAIK